MATLFSLLLKDLHMSIPSLKKGESIRINTVEGVVELFVCPVYGVQMKMGVDGVRPTKKVAPIEMEKDLKARTRAA